VTEGLQDVSQPAVGGGGLFSQEIASCFPRSQAGATFGKCSLGANVGGFPKCSCRALGQDCSLKMESERC
jgi:hypothetical protein